MLQGVQTMAQAVDFKIDDDVAASVLWRTSNERNADGDTVVGEEAKDDGKIMAFEEHVVTTSSSHDEEKPGYVVREAICRLQGGVAGFFGERQRRSRNLESTGRSSDRGARSAITSLSGFGGLGLVWSFLV
jgi:hypothetical protein